MKRPTVLASSSVVVAKDQVSSDLGGEVAILDLKAARYYGLDNAGLAFGASSRSLEP